MRKYLFSLSLILLANSFFAQQISNDVQVVAPYQPTISDAYKVNFLPVINDTAEVKQLFDYGIESKQVKTNFDLEPISAATMLGEPLSKLYRSNFKFGFGNYLTPLFDFNYSTLRSKTKMLGVNLGHLSSNAKLKLTDDVKSIADYSNNYISIFGKQFFDNQTLAADIYVKRNVVYYYGYNVENDSLETFPEDGFKQRFLNAGGNIHYNSTHADSSHMNFDVRLNLDYLQDINAFSQKSFALNTSFNQFFIDKLIGVDFDAAHYIRDNIAVLYNNTIVNIQPWISMFGKDWKATGGINFTGNVLSGIADYHIYPKIELQYSIANNIIIPYAGFNGGVLANDYKKSVFENPFLKADVYVANSNLKKNFYLGLKGGLSSTTSFNIRGSYSEIDNEHFYVNSLGVDSIYENTFDVAYDNIDLLNVYGEILSKPSEKFSFLLKGNYYNYVYLENELKPWHKPQYDVTLSTRYNLQSKIIVRADVFAIGKRFAKSNNPAVEFYELGEIVDINLGIEYRYSKILSAFVNFNNLTSSKYQIWNLYPSQRFNFIAGFSYSL